MPARVLLCRGRKLPAPDHRLRERCRRSAVPDPINSAPWAGLTRPALRFASGPVMHDFPVTAREPQPLAGLSSRKRQARRRGTRRGSIGPPLADDSENPGWRWAWAVGSRSGSRGQSGGATATATIIVMVAQVAAVQGVSQEEQPVFGNHLDNHGGCVSTVRGAGQEEERRQP
jgi:hypothetical protein